MNGMKNILHVLFFPVFLVGLTATALLAETDSRVLTFDKTRLRIAKESGFDVIRYGDLEFSQRVAAPQLPAQIVRLALPPGKEIDRVSWRVLESEYLEGEFTVFPAQPRRSISSSSVPTA